MTWTPSTRPRASSSAPCPSTWHVLKHYIGKKPLFSRFQTEEQIDRVYARKVSLPSGGALVLDQTEALVAIDVNSGKTSGEGVEDMAFKTNMEAAEEVARQLRLRDLAGLIVIDFIDMKREGNNRAVQDRLVDCLKEDKARMEVGKINRFGVLVMTRQRIRPSLQHVTHEACPMCQGSGKVKNLEALVLSVVRRIKAILCREAIREIRVKLAPAIAMAVLNQKRKDLADLEAQHDGQIVILADPETGLRRDGRRDRAARGGTGREALPCAIRIGSGNPRTRRWSWVEMRPSPSRRPWGKVPSPPLPRLKPRSSTTAGMPSGPPLENASVSVPCSKASSPRMNCGPGTWRPRKKPSPPPPSLPVGGAVGRTVWKRHPWQFQALPLLPSRNPHRNPPSSPPISWPIWPCPRQGPGCWEAAALPYPAPMAPQAKRGRPRIKVEAVTKTEPKAETKAVAPKGRKKAEAADSAPVPPAAKARAAATVEQPHLGQPHLANPRREPPSLSPEGVP